MQWRVSARIRPFKVARSTRRGYRLPTGISLASGPLSIYNSNVQYVWKPSLWFAESRARSKMFEAAEKAFGIPPSFSPLKADGLKEHVQAFFVPYWIVRLGMFGPVDYATLQRVYTEGRISIDITFSFSGTDHPALKTLHFLSPNTAILEGKVAGDPPVENFVYVPFSQSLPLSYRHFLENMTTGKDLTISRNVMLRRGLTKTRIAAIPVLEPIIIGEYHYQGKSITVASCPRLGREGVHVYSKGSWTHETGMIGSSKASFSIDWKGSDPDGVDYKSLETALQPRASSWLRAAAEANQNIPVPTAELWAGPLVSSEGFDAVRAWREAKLDLWQEGYELA